MKSRHVGATLFAVGIIGAVYACSSGSSSSSSSGFTCGKAGDKSCPNDTPATQAAVDLCNKCLSQGQAYASCQGITGPSCDANGKSQASTPKTECKKQSDDLVACFLGGALTDAGGGGG